MEAKQSPMDGKWYRMTDEGNSALTAARWAVDSLLVVSAAWEVPPMWAFRVVLGFVVFTAIYAGATMEVADDEDGVYERAVNKIMGSED